MEIRRFKGCIFNENIETCVSVWFNNKNLTDMQTKSRATDSFNNYVAIPIPRQGFYENDKTWPRR